MRNIQVLFLSLFVFISITSIAHSSYGQLLQGIVTVNSGGSISNDPEGRVILKIFAKGASQMRVSNNASFIGARWEAVEGQKNWRLDMLLCVHSPHMLLCVHAPTVMFPQLAVELYRIEPNGFEALLQGLPPQVVIFFVGVAPSVLCMLIVMNFWIQLFSVSFKL